jgi:two-component system nitrate/nitrite response regulator NarL
MALLAVLAPTALRCAALVALLRSAGFEAVEQASDLDYLKCRPDNAPRPDLLIINLGLRDTIATMMQGIKAWAPQTKVVFLVPEFAMHSLSKCFAEGGFGYLLEGISRDGLLHSLSLVSVGEKVFPSELASALPQFTRLPKRTSNIIAFRALHTTDIEIDI